MDSVPDSMGNQELWFVIGPGAAYNRLGQWLAWRSLVRGNAAKFGR